MRRALAVSNASTFGQNQWLVDEMFQQFQRDPQSVDPEWRELFETTGTPSKSTTPNTNPFKQQQPPATPRQAQAQQAANQASQASSVQQLDPAEVATKADHHHIDEANKEEKYGRLRYDGGHVLPLKALKIGRAHV